MFNIYNLFSKINLKNESISYGLIIEISRNEKLQK